MVPSVRHSAFAISMIVRNLFEKSKRCILTGYAASVVGCIFSLFGLRYSLRKPVTLANQRVGVTVSVRRFALRAYTGV
jgi:hypothetical protein